LIDTARRSPTSLVDGAYQSLAASADGVLRSLVYPGLCLDAPALLEGDMAHVPATLKQGLGRRNTGRLWAGGHSERIDLGIRCQRISALVLCPQTA
jgi:hypothetical protein